MERKTFEDKLWSQVEEWKKELDRLRPLAQQKREKEDALNPEREITAQEMVEALENSFEEAKGKIESLHEVAEEAWEKRGKEIRRDIEHSFNELKDRFSSVAQSLKED